MAIELTEKQKRRELETKFSELAVRVACEIFGYANPQDVAFARKIRDELRKDENATFMAGIA